MLTSNIFAAWLIAAPFVTGFTFTAPNQGTTLNLSASTIDIQWTSDSAQYSELNLAFSGPASEGTTFTYTIAANIAVESTQYTWHPSNVSDALLNTSITLSSGKEYYFKAALHNANLSAGANLQSGDYAVTGYQYIGAAEASNPSVGAALLMLASLSVAFSL